MMERTVGIIGAGTMGGALLRRMVESGVIEPGFLYAADPSADRRAAAQQIIGDHVMADNAELARACEVVVLAVKPHLACLVGEQIAGALGERHLVVSIAAGVTLSALQRALGTDRVMRVMPNTPALVGAGAAAYCTGPGATDEDAALVEQMLGAVGICERVEEPLMDAVTGLSGSGPAYIYLAIEALSDGGVKMGLARRVALRLAAATVLGAARMVLETGEHPGVLKDKVTTPGGTTIEALHVLEQGGLRKALMDAVQAATEKSRRLGEQG